MKKIFTYILIVFAVTFAFTACSSNNQQSNQQKKQSDTEIIMDKFDVALDALTSKDTAVYKSNMKELEAIMNDPMYTEKERTIATYSVFFCDMTARVYDMLEREPELFQKFPELESKFDRATTTLLGMAYSSNINDLKYYTETVDRTRSYVASIQKKVMGQ